MLLIILFIVSTCFFIFEPTNAIHSYFSNISANKIDQKHFRLINVVVIVPLVAFFTIFGFFIAKKKAAILHYGPFFHFSSTFGRF